MPHIHLQTTANILENDRIPEILRMLADRLAQFDTIDSASIKAYHTLRESWAMGSGAKPGFVHCEAAILTGRPVELRKEIADGLATLLRDVFASSFGADLAGLTVEIREIDRETYVK